MVEGLICMFCGEDGFETRDELEAHIESHPWTKHKGNVKQCHPTFPLAMHVERD